MEFFLKEIECALDNGLYYIALQSCLTLPDICAALESPDGKSSGAKYKAWYDTHAKEPGRFAMSGEVCYRLRCSYLHQGSTHNPRSPYSRILFCVPNARIFCHNNIFNDVLNVDLNVFCRNIISAVRKWEAQMKDNQIFKENYKQLIRTYPNGVPPFIVGAPVII